MYVLDEELYVSELINTHIKPDELSISYLATLLSKYYIGKCENVNTLIDTVKNELLLFNITDYQEYVFYKKIQTICVDMFNGTVNSEFKKLEFVPVYKSDIDLISSLANDKYKKIMFTLIVNARYMDCSGWINKKNSDGIREIFKQANVSGGDDIRNMLLHNLYKDGYISFAKANMNQNIKINNFEHDDNIMYKVVDFKHLGNQYIGNFKKGYTICKQCGKIIKCTGNKKMYCKKCSEEITREKTRERVNLFREK